ncbi:MAG: hypothetical protein GY950_05755, partial [bacterium]|nr:hypothetical protein [bacterium]
MKNPANKPVLLSNLKTPIKLISLEEISDHPKSLLQGLRKPLAHLAPDFYLQKQNMFEEIEKFYKTSLTSADFEKMKLFYSNRIDFQEFSNWLQDRFQDTALLKRLQEIKPTRFRLHSKFSIVRKDAASECISINHKTISEFKQDFARVSEDSLDWRMIERNFKS